MQRKSVTAFCLMLTVLLSACGTEKPGKAAQTTESTAAVTVTTAAAVTETTTASTAAETTTASSAATTAKTSESRTTAKTTVTTAAKTTAAVTTAKTAAPKAAAKTTAPPHLSVGASDVPQIWIEKQNGEDIIYSAVTYNSPAYKQALTVVLHAKKSDYDALCAKPRDRSIITASKKYEYYLTEDSSKSMMKAIAQTIMKQEAFAGLTEYQKICEAIAYVQAYPYVTDQDSVGRSEYWRFPMETVFTGAGDCEDSSLLLAGILHEMGFETVFIIVAHDDFAHMAIGIQTDDRRNANFEAYGNHYYYIETTGNGWKMGVIPDVAYGTLHVINPKW